MKKLLIPLLVFSVCLGSCGSNDDSEPKLDRIEISSSNGEKLDLGESTSLSITTFDQFNKPIEIKASLLEWVSDNDNVTVNQEGIVTAQKVGVSTITVSVEEIKATIKITIWDSTAPRIEIYVSDVADYWNLGPPQIIKYDENGKNPEVFIDKNLGAPQDILFLEDQEVVLISNATTGRITKYDATTGAYISNFATNISFPTRMKIGPDGLLYVLQWSGDYLVLRFELDGTPLGAFTSVGVRESIGMDWDTDGNLYVSSYNENGATGFFVKKFDPSGNDLGTFISSGLSGPTNIWFDDSGNLMVNDWLAGTIVKFSSSGSFISTFTSGIQQVEGVDFLDNGDILIGVGSSATVNQYTNSGTLVKSLVPSRSGGLIKPNAVRVRRINF